MMICKFCEGSAVKNGVIGGDQRYKCKSCHRNFVSGDARIDEKRLEVAMQGYASNEAAAEQYCPREKALWRIQNDKDTLEEISKYLGVSVSVARRLVKAEAARYALAHDGQALAKD